MDFTGEYIKDIFVGKVWIKKATFLEAEQFRNFLSTAMNNDVKKYIIDLSCCISIDPIFIGVIIQTYKKLININGNLKIIRPKLAIHSNQNFENTLRIFETFLSIEEAVDSYKKIFVKPAEELITNRVALAVT
ncbi:MAG: hypothetical protein M1480_19640 [Bacteroidetes bacterium]|nr:hypothetical protein [Bacteroidota bacterium]